jgi:hypothetical protein
MLMEMFVYIGSYPFAGAIFSSGSIFHQTNKQKERGQDQPMLTPTLHLFNVEMMEHVDDMVTY